MQEDVQPKFVHTETKLFTKFQIKDRTKDRHKYDLLYHAKCPKCNLTYMGETGRRLQNRSMNMQAKIVSQISLGTPTK